jgi:glycosyltransferase involved in cell wall biosynthesis
MLIIVMTSWNSGGAEKFVYQLASYASRVCEVVVVSKRGKESDHLYIQFVHLLGKEKVLGLTRFRDFLKVCKILLKNDCVVFNVRGTFALDFNALARLLGSRTISCYRESEYQYKKTFLKILSTSILERLLLLTNQVYTNSPILPSKFLQRNFRQGRIKKVDNYIQENLPSWAKSIDEKCINICHIGRPSGAKNYETLLESVRGVASRSRKFYKVHLIGPGVQGYVEGLNDTNCENITIEFYGYVQSPAEVILNSDIFLFPSSNEGQPNALLEALSMGIPCLASNIEAIKEAVPLAFAETLINSRDSEKFSDALMKLVEEGPDYDRKEVSLYVKQRYSIDNTIAKLIVSIGLC